MAITYDPTTADPGRMEKVPAEHVVIDLNVRQDVRLDKSFISSVRVQGFIQPPVGFTDENAHVHVTVGQRRVSAALEIGWPVIPILIKPKAAAEADRADELRILTQIAENEQRASLTPAELAAGYNVAVARAETERARATAVRLEQELARVTEHAESLEAELIGIRKILRSSQPFMIPPAIPAPEVHRLRRQRDKARAKVEELYTALQARDLELTRLRTRIEDGYFQHVQCGGQPL